MIRTMRLADLRAAPYNPRRISDEAKAGLSNSLARFGLVQTLIWNRRSKRLVAGHQRLDALRALGAKAAPVVEVDLSEIEEKALNVALNSPEIAGEFTPEVGAILDEIREKAEDLFSDLRFDALSESLAGMIAGAAPKEGLTDPDEIPPARKDPGVKRGDLFAIGEHRLMCGDAMKRETYSELLREDPAPEVLLTDPPYGVSHGSGITKAKAIVSDLGQAVIPVFFAIAVEALEKDARIYVFGGSNQMSMYAGMFDVHLRKVAHIIVWVKDSFVLRQNGYHSQFEFVFYGWKGAGGGIDHWYGDRKGSDVWKVSRDRLEDRTHPTQKPVDLLSIPVSNSCPPGGLVLDPFGGSGSTLIACEQLGRRARLIEIDPVYCRVILDRWEAFTGRKAEKIS